MIDYDLSDLRCFGQGNVYPSQRATMDQVDRIMPIGSLIPWIPRLNPNNDEKATYHQTKGWIKCDGIEKCDHGLFEGQVCPSLANKGLIGANKNLKTAVFQGASIPQHQHKHKHTMYDHKHTTKITRRSDKDYIGVVYACEYAKNCGSSDKKEAAARHNHQGSSTVTSSSTTSQMKDNSAGVTSVTGANIGENLPAHMRVEYLFECY